MRKYVEDVNPLLKRHNTVLGAYISIIFYTLIFSAGIKYFVLPHPVFSGGFSGVAQVLVKIFPGLEVGQLLIYLNIPVLILSYFYLSKRFFLRTLLTIFLSGYLIDALPQLPNGVATSNILLSVVFGGVVIGFSIGKILENYASTGGIDIIGTVLLKSGKNIGVGGISIIMNLIIFTAAFYLEQNIETVMYSVVLTFVVGFVIDRTQSQVNMTMITVYSKRSGLGNIISDELNRSSTRFDVIGGYSSRKLFAYQIIVDNSEIKEVKKIARNYDDDAFIVFQDVREVRGNFTKRIT
jgi:uncharacterized membrane-anchored protein YitT (DUF2179 family)